MACTKSCLVVVMVVFWGCSTSPTGSEPDSGLISPFLDQGGQGRADGRDGGCVGGPCDAVCLPDCTNRECGDDGCGGSCGSCPQVAPECNQGVCTIPCEASCVGRECGSDGCGGSCGNCPDAAPLCADGLCALECFSDCSGKSCGDDGCEGSCGECAEGKNCLGGNCTAPGELYWPCTNHSDCISGVCLDFLDGKVCASVCGDCPTGWSCISLPVEGSGTLDICAPECLVDCAGNECGDNGCGGACGFCPAGEGCFSGVCKPGPCVPDCTDMSCGADGCGGHCGACPEGAPVCQQGQCIIGACTPKCGGIECGEDGCGGVCGECAPFFYECQAGHCVSTCEPSCANKDCGSDGCDGICGFCTDDFHCQEGICIPDCLPECAGKECGDDGCGNLCGACGVDGVCVNGQCVVPGEPSDCKNVLNCLIGCDSYTACIGDCLSQASAAGQVAYDDMILCGQEFCGEWEVGTPQNQLCVLQACDALWSVCVGGWGGVGCNQILTCTGGCNSQQCMWNCIYQGTQSGQQTFWNMQVCFQANCAYCGQDQQCWSNCAQAVCGGQVAACQAN